MRLLDRVGGHVGVLASVEPVLHAYERRLKAVFDNGRAAGLSRAELVDHVVLEMYAQIMIGGACVLVGSIFRPAMFRDDAEDLVDVWLAGG
jgi:hypothetical protein